MAGNRRPVALAAFSVAFARRFARAEACVEQAPAANHASDSSGEDLSSGEGQAELAALGITAMPFRVPSIQKEQNANRDE
jgi:hypothetical protein